MTTPSDSTGTAGNAVQMRVPATVAFVSTLRITAASLAARCNLTVDDIEDLRLAVDEACALLLPHAEDAGTLDATFHLDEGKLAVDTSVRSKDSAEPDRDGFAWTVLGALASSVDVAHDGERLTITVTKQREAAHQ